MAQISFFSNTMRDQQEMDTVKASNIGDRRRAYNVLFEAQRYYDNMDKFRKERDRNKRYYYGDQWGDSIEDENGHTVSEEQYILDQGTPALKTNLIRRLGRNVIGVYRNQDKEPTCTARDRDEQKLGETMTTVLQYNRQINKMSKVNARTMEDLLIGGLVVHRDWYGWRRNKLDCWCDYVHPDTFFIDNNMKDFRGWDVSCIGEIHDVTFSELCSQFVKCPEDYSVLKRIYREAADRSNISDNCERFGTYRISNLDFFFPTNPTLCRVIEVWRKEMKPRYRCHDYLNGDVYKIDIEDYDELVDKVNKDRMQQGLTSGIEKDDVKIVSAEWFMDSYWYFYYLTPFGDILSEGETPYEHKEHPYVFEMYPFIDGEIHSFVGDVIDQQRYVNRLITLYDWIMRASAKGALLFPEGSLPDGYTMEDIADEWTRFNGLVVYKPKPGVAPPQQISANSTNIGIGELLNLQLKFFEDISGVNGALQGKPGYSTTSGSLYAQQTQNATTSLLDLLETFSDFIVDESYKTVKNIQQFYDSKRVLNIVGKSGKPVEYDPKKIRDVEFDMSIVESQSTPAYRQVANDFLMQIWSAGQISLEQMLSVGNFPFSDELLQSVQTQKEQMESGQQPNDLSPQLQQQTQQGVNMGAVNQMYNAMQQPSTT